MWPAQPPFPSVNTTRRTFRSEACRPRRVHIRRRRQAASSSTGVARARREIATRAAHRSLVGRHSVGEAVTGGQVQERTTGARLRTSGNADRLDDPLVGALAAFGTTHGLLAAGAFDLARTRLEAALAAVPTRSMGAMQLAGMLNLIRSLLAAAEGNSSDPTAPLDAAAELAERTGEANASWFGFGPTNVGAWRMSVCAGKRQPRPRCRARRTAGSPQPPVAPATRCILIDYARALAQLRGRRDEAVMAFRRAEMISPTRVYRHPFAHETIAELVERSRRDAIGRELRGLASRAGLLA
jgi:hypothetical protein